MRTSQDTNIFKGYFISITSGIFLIASLILTYIVLKTSIWDDVRLDLNHKQTKGLFVDFAETTTIINDDVVTEFIYEYETEEKEQITSFSYHTEFYNMNIGDTVIIDYHPTIKYLSRIHGLRTSEIGIIAFLVLLLPIISGIAVAYGVSLVFSAKKQ